MIVGMGQDIPPGTNVATPSWPSPVFANIEETTMGDATTVAMTDDVNRH